MTTQGKDIPLCRQERLAEAENRFREHNPRMPADDGAEQEALFTLDRPDEDGCVWICATQSDWCQNLGPRRKVAAVLTQWLADAKT